MTLGSLVSELGNGRQWVALGGHEYVDASAWLYWVCNKKYFDVIYVAPLAGSTVVSGKNEIARKL